MACSMSCTRDACSTITICQDGRIIKQMDLCEVHVQMAATLCAIPSIGAHRSTRSSLSVALVIYFHFQPLHQLLLMTSSDNRLITLEFGVIEISLILSALRSETPLRPLSHDLMLLLISSLGGDVSHVEINTSPQPEGYLLARIELHRDTVTSSVSARPSDAICLALRAKVPIFDATPSPGQSDD